MKINFLVTINFLIKGMLDKIKENIKENITQIENRNDIDENQKSEKKINLNYLIFISLTFECFSSDSITSHFINL